ncbi:hypothetical protein HU200_049145 [Digitaria exilis]|uniref:Uncharacterized protein n=1 Tax=Digitaria exilis TaxID=1010633 RepID=A0A835AVF0_9POAL|nr:hypothetical protein HU200_049145 [Digitaria exilis]
MAKIVHCLMATLFVILVMIPFNSPFSQAACMGPWCGVPCFPPKDNHCTNTRCGYFCQYLGYDPFYAYCKRPKPGKKQVYLCCCPGP